MDAAILIGLFIPDFFLVVSIFVIIDYFIFTELKNCFIYFFFVNLLSKGFE